MPERVRVLPETLEYPPAEISESLPAIFGLARTLGPQDRQRVLARIVDAASTVNVPVLATSPDWNYGDGSLVFLDDQAQQIIKARTQHLVAAPYRSQLNSMRWIKLAFKLG